MCNARLLLVFVFIYLFHPTLSVTNVLTQTACESYSLSIRCSERDERILILDASYGRTSGMTCAHKNDVNKFCKAKGTVDIVADRCNGRNRCDIQANNIIFGDPCPGTAKYLFVQYKCESEIVIREPQKRLFTQPRV